MPQLFRAESDLQHVLALTYLQRGFLVATEVTAGPSGIADVVAWQPCKQKLMQRRATGQVNVLTSRSQMQVFLQLPDEECGSISEDDLAAAVGLSRKYLRQKILRRLEAEGFAVRSENGLHRVNGWYPLVRNTIAIEAKLSSVSRAIEQALSYRYFANEVYIALPSPVAYRARKRRDLKGVGIIAARPDKAWCIKRSQRHDPLSALCCGLAAEAAWLAAQNGGFLEGIHQCPTQFPQR